MTQSQIDGLRVIATQAEFENIRIEAANILDKQKRFPAFDFKSQVLDLLLAYAKTKLGQVATRERRDERQMTIRNAEQIANTILEAGNRIYQQTRPT